MSTVKNPVMKPVMNTVRSSNQYSVFMTVFMTVSMTIFMTVFMTGFMTGFFTGFITGFMTLLTEVTSSTDMCNPTDAIASKNENEMRENSLFFLFFLKPSLCPWIRN